MLLEIDRQLSLTWIEAEMSSKQTDTDSTYSLIIPPYEEMQLLYVLALAGNMRDIRQWSDHIASVDQKYQPFAETLINLAKNYQSQAILDMVEAYMRQE